MDVFLNGILYKILRITLIFTVRQKKIYRLDKKQQQKILFIP